MLPSEGMREYDSALPSLCQMHKGFAENGYSFRYTSQATPGLALYASMARLELLVLSAAPRTQKVLFAAVTKTRSF